MGVIGKYVVKNILYNKKKCILIAFLYMISAMFFVTEALALFGYFQGNQQQLDRAFGIHDGIFSCISQKGVDQVVRDSRVEFAGIMEVKAAGMRNENYRDRMIIMGSMDETAENLSRITLLKGHLPQEADEIVMEQSLLNLVYPGVEIGQEIEARLTRPEEKTVTMRLSGVMENLSLVQWNITDSSENEENQVAMINAIVSKEMLVNSPLYYFVNIKFQVGMGEISKIVGDLSGKEGVLGYVQNQRNTYNTMSILGFGEENTGIIVLIGTLLLFTISILVVVSYIFERGHEKNVGLLTVAGFSYKSIKKFFVMKLGFLIIPALLLGMGCGVLISSYMMQYINGVLSIGETVVVLLVCGMVICLVSFFTLHIRVGKTCRKPVIENLRQNQVGNAKDTSVKLHTTNPVLLYSVKNYILNGKESIAASVMVFFAVVLLIFTVTLSYRAQIYMESLRHPYDIEIRSLLTHWYPIAIPRNRGVGITQQEYEALRDNVEVENILALKMYTMYELTHEDVVYDTWGDTDEEFLYWKDFLGFPKDYNIREVPTFETDERVIEKIQDYVVEGSIHIEALKNGDEVLYCYNEGGECDYRAGDSISFMNGIIDNPEEFEPEDIRLFRKKVTIGAVVRFKNDVAEAPFYRSMAGFVFTGDTYENIGIHIGYQSMNIVIKDKSNYASVSSLLNEILSKHEGDYLRMNNFLQSSTVFQQFYSSFIVIAVVLVVGLSFFSMISLVVMVSMKIAKRRQLFGFLRAVGLTERQMFAIVYIENGLAILISFFFAFLCGLIISSVMNGFGAAGGECLGITGLFFFIYLLIIAVISYSSTHKLFKQTIIDCIRTEE